MKIPESLSEHEVINTITKVARKLAPKYVFASYEVEDIEQEAFMMGVEGLKRYDTNKPLENFMYTHINNRLKNFKRDNYYRFDYGNAQRFRTVKKSILEPADITALYCVSIDDETLENAHLSEMIELIDKMLPADLRSDYLKLRTNSPLPKGRKAIVIQAIEDILNGDYDEEG